MRSYQRDGISQKVETLNLSDSGFKAISKGHIYDIISKTWDISKKLRNLMIETGNSRNVFFP